MTPAYHPRDGARAQWLADELAHVERLAAQGRLGSPDAVVEAWHEEAERQQKRERAIPVLDAAPVRKADRLPPLAPCSPSLWARFHGTRWPSGWWIAPMAALGAVLWGLIGWAVS